jgi:hypothetical protein
MAGSWSAKGAEFRLADDWLVASNEYTSPAEGLGYALLRIAGSPGAQPIGGARAESSERLRQWIELPAAATVLRPDDQLLIMMHQHRAPLRLSLGRLTGTSPDGQRLFYDNASGPGSSGAPCFTQDLQLVGMHLGADRRGIGNGVMTAAILADLERQGLAGAARTRFA